MYGPDEVNRCSDGGIYYARYRPLSMIAELWITVDALGHLQHIWVLAMIRYKIPPRSPFSRSGPRGDAAQVHVQ
jgi:hypothetical protein